MTDSDEVWVKRGASGTANARYHTDEDCSYLQNARSKQAVSRHEAEDVRGLTLCVYCAGEWPANEPAQNPMELRDRLIEADPDPWPPEGES